MSRIGKQPVAVPAGVKVRVADGKVFVEGPKGAKLEQAVHRNMRVEIDEAAKVIKVIRPDDDRQNRALHGLTRSLIANMVQGVTKGYESKLELVGVGFRAQVSGKSLNLTLGFSHPVSYPIPEGITIEAPSLTEVLIKGTDRQRVGQIAAEIRDIRPPEPYKGKGVRYKDEQISLKEGKKK
jgi:large subunit ribosomal protein L6